MHTVVVTHSHPDHFGGAGWVRNETGAEIVTHERFRMIWDRNEPPDVDVEDVAEAAVLESKRRRRPREPWDPPPWGGEGHPFSFKRRMRMRAVQRSPRLFRTPMPTRAPGRPPGRSASPGGSGSRCTRRATPRTTSACSTRPSGVMLSGDHVLPTITPHIGGLNPHGDPLLDFFESLDKVAAYGPDVSVVLPAHGHPFDDLAGRAKAIQEHHVGRLDLLRTDRPTSSAARPACRSCRRTCSRPGPRARWPTARRSPTSSTSAAPASSNAAIVPDRLRVRPRRLSL